MQCYCVHKLTSKVKCSDQHCVWGRGPIFAIIINVFNNSFPTMPKLHAFYKKSTDIISMIVGVGKWPLDKCVDLNTFY